MEAETLYSERVNLSILLRADCLSFIYCYILGRISRAYSFNSFSSSSSLLSCNGSSTDIILAHNCGNERKASAISKINKQQANLMAPMEAIRFKEDLLGRKGTDRSVQ